MTPSTPSRGRRLRGAVGVSLGLLILGWGLALWNPLSREPRDTAPLDIRGKPIRTIVPTNPAPSAARMEGVPPARQLAAAAPGTAPPESEAGFAGTGTTTTPRADDPSASGTSFVAETDPDGHLIVTFDQLAGFTYEMPDLPLPAGAGAETLAGRIPHETRALDGQQVAVKGFMLPMKLEHGRATELLLMRDQSMCCFGVVPMINEWLNVKMAKGVKPIMDQPVTIAGTLRVGEVVENGYLVYIYALDGETLTTALDE